MEAKHTQGPWKVKALTTYNEPGYAIMWPGTDGQYTRRLDYRGNFSESDARLIAAAPDLLVACKTAEAWLGKVENAAPYMSMIRAAIAKATDIL